MDYLCVKFGNNFSFSRFGFIVRAESQTESQRRMIAILTRLVGVGALQMQYLKMQDMKLTNQTTGREIAGHENEGHEENSRLFIIVIIFQCRLVCEPIFVCNISKVVS